MSALETPPGIVKLPRLRSLRFGVLARNLCVALVLGGIALMVNLHVLHTPLQQTQRAVTQGQELQTQDNLRAIIEDAQNFSAMLNAAVYSVWGDPDRTIGVGKTLMDGLVDQPSIIAAAVWIDPRYFNASKACGTSGDWLEVCASDTEYTLPTRVNSLYWQKQAGGQRIEVSTAEQANSLWFAPMQQFQQRGCFWSGQYREPYLNRPVMACLIPLRKQQRLVGVSAVLIDPESVTLQRDRTDTNDYVVLGSDNRVMASTLAGIAAGAELTTLASADDRLAAAVESLEEDAQRQLRQAQSIVPDWNARVASLVIADTAATPSMMERIQTRLTLLGVADHQPQGVIAVETGVRLYPLDDAGTLISLRSTSVGLAGLPFSFWTALAATAGLLSLALLIYQLLTTRLSVTPLRRIIKQLNGAKDGDVIDVGGSAEIVELSQLLNLRQLRIQELIQRNSNIDPHQPVRVTASRDGDEGWAMVDALPDAVVVTTADGEVQYLNRAAETLSGKNLAQAQNRSFDEVFTLFDRRGTRRLGHMAQAGTESSRRDEPPLFAVLRDDQQRQLPIAISRRLLRAGPEKANAMVIVIRTMLPTSGKTASSASQAERDALTGACNRMAFEAELEARCTAAKSENITFALLYLDVDGMTAINQKLGKTLGDEFLRQLSRLIQSDVGEANPVYRLHDDKFAVLLSNADPAEAQVVAELLRADIGSWQFDQAGQQYDASVSIGLVHASGESGRAVDVLRQASELSQQAQQQGGARVVASQIRLRRQTLRDERGWLAALTQGIAQDRFRLSTQKIVALQRQTDSAAAFDTLLSFEDDEGLEVPASSFMPIAARHDVVQQIDRWMMASVFQQLAQDKDRLEELDFCIVPLSVRSMHSPHFLDFLFEHFKSSGIPPGKICVDLNESDVHAQIGNVRSFCHTMAQAGCRLSLSGVSTRPSSYELIKQLPVQLVRFDPLLTRQIDTDAVERLATESLHRIVYTLGKQSMVTQVNSEALLKLVQKIGIHYAQGDAIEAVSRRGFQSSKN